MPTGLSTLRPRRRSPDNQVAVGEGWVTPSTASAGGRIPPLATPPAVFCSRSGQSGHDGRLSGVNIAPIKLMPEVAVVLWRGATVEHRPFQIAELRFPPFAHRALIFSGIGAVDEAWKTPNVWCFPGAGRAGSRFPYRLGREREAAAARRPPGPLQRGSAPVDSGTRCALPRFMCAAGTAPPPSAGWSRTERPESRVLATASTPHARPPVVSLRTTPSGLQP